MNSEANPSYCSPCAIVRKTKVFGGSSHPELTALITGRLGVEAGAVKLSQFKNKETSVEIGNVFVLSHLVINWPLQVLTCKKNRMNMIPLVTFWCDFCVKKKKTRKEETRDKVV